MTSAAAEIPTPTPLPELKTTTLPSNGQLLAEETNELLEATLAAMRTDIANGPAWSGAPAPTDDFLLMFIRAEVFSPSRAADRYRKFWEAKLELFGEDKAALPIKAKDVKEALDRQFLQILPGVKDVEGRQVVLIIPGNVDKTIDRKLRVRAAWYVLLAALEDVETQRRGLCFVGLGNTARLSNVDPKFSKMVLSGVQGALPARVGSISLCYPPSFFRLVWGILSVVLHAHVKKRFRVLPGTDDEVRNAIRPIISPESLPSPIGTKELDFPAWMETRIRAEV
ncbi:unnamed protein product [Ascophyllum nodosum]